MKFTYTGIEVKDMDESIRFYRDGLGMELPDRHPIPATSGEVAALRSPSSEQLLELNWYPKRKSGYRAGDGLDHLAFEVADVPGAIRRLLERGAKPARDVEVRPRFVVGFVKDPNGIWIELYAPRGP